MWEWPARSAASAISLGADEVIDYRTVDLTEAVKDVDIVLDPIAGDTLARLLDVLRPGGTLVSLLGGDPQVAADGAGRGIRVEGLLVEADHAGTRAIADLVEAGTLRAHVEAVFPLSEAAQAHALGETNRTTGKIVLMEHRWRTRQRVKLTGRVRC
ncbi:zinc-binding dehydrogenase [Streptomyces sp. NPDC050121]|uniref:zinc-binding dehydrogenase n=1 Tax=Streptomyces sp. NPDC050121 TaxID=3365601 RepID=UPI00378AAA08